MVKAADRGTRRGRRPSPEELIERYARKLPERVAEVGELVAALTGDPGDPDRRERARAAAHRLRGTAGSFGFPQVSECVGRIDDHLRRAGADGPIDLAVLDDALATAGSLVHRAPAAAPPQVESWKARLLLVTPDTEACEHIQELGRRRLIDIAGAPTAEEALRRARRDSFDGALVDLGPDEHDEAFEIASRIRAVPGNAALPIAFTSSDQAARNRVRAANAGAALFLPKPLTESRLDDAGCQLSAIRRASRPRVLILDDDDEFLAHASLALGHEGVQVRTLSHPDDLLAILDNSDPEALLVDISMPGIDGLDVCRMLRTTTRWQDLPILVVTADRSDDARLEAYRAGCDDVIHKPVVREELRIRVKLRVERQRLVHTRLERDPLTGLPLRRKFIERLRSRLSEAHRRGYPVALVLLDLDHFKQINDRHGHLAGDHALAHLGHLLAARFRSEDLRARWGGEEFIAAFPGESRETAARLATQALDELARARIEADDGGTFAVTFSAGVAQFPDDGASMEALLRAVDRRLYAAKADGRARVIATDST